MRILLAAEESTGARALRLIAESPHHLAAVLTASSPATPGSAAALALSLGVPVLDPALLRDPSFASTVRSLQPDILLNVHALYRIRPEILDAAPSGAFNVHPGPLPAYAGLNAPSWAIFHGESSHAVTLHGMTSGIDEGDIAYQHQFPLSPQSTGLSVSLDCAKLGLQLLARLLDDLAASHPIPRIPQDLSLRRYFSRQAPFHGRPPLSLTAAELHRLVRASHYHPFPSPWPAPTFFLDSQPIPLLQTALTHEPASQPPGTLRHQNQTVQLACQDHWLEIQKLLLNHHPSSPHHLPSNATLTSEPIS